MLSLTLEQTIPQITSYKTQNHPQGLVGISSKGEARQELLFSSECKQNQENINEQNTRHLQVSNDSRPLLCDIANSKSKKDSKHSAGTPIKKTLQVPSSFSISKQETTAQAKNSQSEPFCTSINTYSHQNKSRIYLLAEELENKFRIMDIEIGMKIEKVKQEFRHSKIKEKRFSHENSFIKKPRKKSLISHLQRKHSDSANHKDMKDSYLKFIPMQQMLTHAGIPLENSRIIQSKLITRFSAELKL